jgi:hypothetical protein
MGRIVLYTMENKKCLKPPTSKTCQNQYCRYGPNVKSRLYKRPIRQSTDVFSKAPRGLWAFTSPSEVGDRQEIIKSLANHMIPYEWPNSGLYYYPIYIPCIYTYIYIYIIIIIYNNNNTNNNNIIIIIIYNNNNNNI